MKNSKFLTKLFAMSAAVVMALTSFAVPANAEENETVSGNIEEAENDTYVDEISIEEFSAPLEMEVISSSMDEYKANNGYFQLVDGEKFNVVKYMNLNKKNIKKFEVTVSDNTIKTKVSRSGKVSKIKRGVIGITALMKDGTKSNTLWVDAYKPKKVKLKKADKSIKINTWYSIDKFVEGIPNIKDGNYIDKHFGIEGKVLLASLADKVKYNSNNIYINITEENGKEYIGFYTNKGELNYKVKSMSFTFKYRNDQEIADNKKAKKKIKISGLKINN